MVKSMTIIFLDYNIDEKEYYINYGDKKIYPFKQFYSRCSIYSLKKKEND